jgi:hypothetical protein
MPTSIICFDGNISPESIKFAQELGVPIVNIDRQAYKDQNAAKLTENHAAFAKDLSLQALKKIFYRTSPEDMLDIDLSTICAVIAHHASAPAERKQACLTFLATHIDSLWGEKVMCPVRYYTDEVLEKKLGTYKSDTDKISEATSRIHNLQQSVQQNAAPALTSAFLKRRAGLNR